MTRFTLDNDAQVSVPSHVYLIFESTGRTNGNSQEPQATATSAKERDQKCCHLDSIPGSGMVYWVRYNTRSGRNNSGRWP